jgi:hypothetical protein
VFIRDLIFGRRLSAGERSVSVAARLEAQLSGFAEAAVAPFLSQGAEDASTEAEPAEAKVACAQAVLIPADRPEADRQALVAEEVASAHSPQIVSLQAADWSVELVVANRRLMAARIAGRDGHALHDLRQADHDEERAVALCRAVAEKIAEPVDLTLTSRHGAGVYAANGGLPATLIFAGEAAVRTAHRPPEVAS